MLSIQKRFNYQIWGDEGLPRLVFLHGLLGSWANWRSVIKHFEDHYQVLAFDQRGHGRSLHQGPYHIYQLAQDLEQILDELCWDKIDLVGHSMGGRVAIVFACAQPQKIRSLVIEDIGPASSKVSAQKAIDLIQSVPTPFSNRTSAKEFFEGEFLRLWPQNAQISVLSKFFYSNLKEDSDKSLSWRFDKAGIIALLNSSRENDLWHEFRTVTCPTLCIRGGLSNELSQDLFRETVECNPHISGIEVPGAGHWVHFEKMPEFVRALKDFL